MEAIMWIARDKDGLLFMSANKPERDEDEWYSSTYEFIGIDDTLFRGIKWKDPEPTKVLIKIIK